MYISRNAVRQLLGAQKVGSPQLASEVMVFEGQLGIEGGIAAGGAVTGDEQVLLFAGGISFFSGLFA